MRADPILHAALDATHRRRDALIAIALALLLSLSWAIADWAQLRWFTLPDSDDMMRLAQVRDWLAGQRFDDWTQYRLAPPTGAPMHWSRVNDLGLAAIVLATRPLLGERSAELAAILAYPAALFAAYLFLAARLARRLAGPAAALVALVLAAIAYPADSLFLPGRIDHHAIEIVLVLAATLALTQPASWKSGAAAGAAIGVALGVGLEVAPQAAALIAVAFALWAIRGAAERTRLAGVAGALVATTLVLLALFRPAYWSADWCDAFTPASSTATLAGAAVLAALAAMTPLLRSPASRAALGLAAGGGALALTLRAYPACLTGPYGPMDPFVRHAFMDNVVEARGLFAQGSLALALPVVGMMAVASVAGLLLARHGAWRRWLPVLATLAMCDAVMLVQVRGAYFGSALAAPVLAALVVAARRHGALATAAAWLASAGMVWLIVPIKLEAMLAPRTATMGGTPQVAKMACKVGDTWAQLDAWAPGTVMASMDMGAYVIGGSHHGSVAAGYHRNNRGNRAMYDFFLANPARARAIARGWHVAYVVSCPTDFAELDVTKRYPDSLAAALVRGRHPGWLEPLPLRDTGLAFYRVR